MELSTNIDKLIYLSVLLNLGPLLLLLLLSDPILTTVLTLLLDRNTSSVSSEPVESSTLVSVVAGHSSAAVTKAFCLTDQPDKLDLKLFLSLSLLKCFLAVVVVTVDLGGRLQLGDVNT